MKSKEIRSHLISEWKLLVLSLVLLPIGIGFVLLFIVFQRWRVTYWELFDSYILIHGKNDSTKLELESMLKVESVDVSLFGITGLSNIKIESEKGTFLLTSVKNGKLIADSLSEILIKLNEFNQKRIPPREEEFADIAVGGLEGYNDLVGLWQAGLISNEDFYEEQKKFK